MSKQGYTKPKLSELGGDVSKEWYVIFRHTCPEHMVRKQYQVRQGINRFHTATERRADGRALEKVLLKALESGWNPHHENIEQYVTRLRTAEEPTAFENHMMAAHELGEMPLNAALDYAFQKKKPNLTKKSVSGIGGVKDFAKVAAVKLGIDKMPVKDTKRVHIKLLLDQIGKDRQAVYDKEGEGKQWSGNSYNKYKGFLQAIFVELREFEAIEYNPCDNIGNKPSITTNIHRHATDKERYAIKEQLQRKAPHFYIYLTAEYLTGIRPNELMGIRVADIDWFNQAIDIHPVEGGAKNRKARKVPMPDVMLKYMKKLKLEDYKPTDFIFSKSFRPGPKRMGRDYATKLWKELVKDGLGLNVSLYSFKGLGGEDKRKAGIGIDAVSKQYGHSSLNMTKVYLHGETDRINQVIKERTPDL